jgi:prepilin-type N-terminal cleavage/methylation domain-containing protein
MKHKYHKSGFTLLETMIALGIVVLALGAGASVNRALLVGAKVSDETFHANQLADSAISMVQVTQAYVLNKTTGDKSLSAYFNLSGNTEHVLIPYSTTGGTYTQPNNRNQLAWCVSGSSLTCGNTQSRILNGVTQRTISQDLSGRTIAGVLWVSGEHIAVQRGSTDTRNIIDYFATGASVPGLAECTATCTWEYYLRKITMKKLSEPTFISGNGSLYQLRVEVTNMRTRTAISRVVLLSDFGAVGSSVVTETFPVEDDTTIDTGGPAIPNLIPGLPGPAIEDIILTPGLPSASDGIQVFDSLNNF